VGDTIRVDDLDLPEGVSTDVDGEAAIVVGQPPQLEDLSLLTEAQAEAAAAEAAEDAGGDAAAADGAAEGGEGGAAEGGEGAGE
jgi:hypothetical protein